MLATERADDQTDVSKLMAEMGRAARAAARTLAQATSAQKAEALAGAAQGIRGGVKDILEANAKDLEAAKARGISPAFIDRLALDEARINGIASGLDEVAKAKDPVGDVMDEWTRPNGLRISRVRTPLGVIAVIYESRPNVTADAAALCVKSGNAVILRGGSESFHSSAAIHQPIAAALKAAGLPEAAAQLVPTTDRAAVGEILAGLGGEVDIIVPRGGRSLVERVQKEARAPVFGHLEGLCHVYVDKAADLEKAQAIAVNAKMRRTGICGSAETLLVDQTIAEGALPGLADALIAAGCALRGDEASRGIDGRITPASDEDWRTEYLAPVISIRVVEGVQGAIDHIAAYGSGHTDSIVTEDAGAAERFLTDVDSAIVMHNASTQFADGGEFGMGAEIGIATGRIHARGPVGAEQLTSFKYVVRGDGQVRP